MDAAEILLEKLVSIAKKDDEMSDLELTYNTRKALCVHIGEPAGVELANLLRRLVARVEQLERTKVNVTPVAPDSSANLMHSAYGRDIS